MTDLQVIGLFAWRLLLLAQNGGSPAQPAGCRQHCIQSTRSKASAHDVGGLTGAGCIKYRPNLAAEFRRLIWCPSASHPVHLCGEFFTLIPELVHADADQAVHVHCLLACMLPPEPWLAR